MSENLLKNVKITRTLGYFAAAQTNRDGSIIDMQGYEGVLFIAHFETLLEDGTIELVADHDDVNDTAGMNEVTSATVVYTVPATVISNVTLALDIYKPLKRYIRAGIELGTSNAVITGITAIQYKNHKGPVTQSALTTGVLAQATLISPPDA